MDQNRENTEIKHGKGLFISSLVIVMASIGLWYLITYFNIMDSIIHHSMFGNIIAGIIVILTGISLLAFTRWLCLRRELPSRLKSERALKNSEERFKSLINSLDDVVFTTDRRNRYTAVFGRWVKGYEKLHPDEFIGKTPRELFGAIEGSIHEESIKQALDGDSVVYEWSMNTNGDSHHFKITVSPLRDEQRKIIGVVGVGHDVTDKKEYERELHRHEQESKLLLENTPDIIARYDCEERYMYVNRAFEFVMGTTSKQVIGKHHRELAIPKELIPFWQGSIASVFLNGEEVILDSELPTPTGIRYYQARLVPEFNTENKAEYVLVVARDLTKYKRTEDSLRRSEEQLERILQTTPGGVSIIDINGRIYYANQTAEQILGLTAKKTIDRYYNEPSYKVSTVDGKPLPEKDLPYIRVMLTGNPVYGLEHAIEHPDGRRLILSVNAAPLLDYNQKITGIVTSISDITELKKAEEEARKNEERFRGLANSISDVFFAIDRDLHITYWNHASEILTGIPVKKAIGNKVLDLLPNTMRTELHKLFNESLTSQSTKTHLGKAKVKGKLYYFDIYVYPAKHGLSVFFKNVSERIYADRERERLITELQDALNKVKTLSGLLPICAFCKNIRDDGGYWHQVESYIKEHSEANFSHGVCPDCAKKHYPEYFKEENHEEKHAD